MINYKLFSQFRAAGLNAAPCKRTKAPNLAKWTAYQQQQIPDNVLKRSVNDSQTFGIGVICGKVSGNLEVIDIDSKYDKTGSLFADYCEIVDKISSGLIKKLVIAETQNAGYHLYFRCSKIAGNQKLASNTEGQVLLETRGEGGFIVTAPTKGYDVVNGSLLNIPTITEKEREALIQAAKSFDSPKEEEPKKTNGKKYDESIFDYYDNTTDVLHELSAHGWSLLFSKGGVQYLRRPGKSEGISATFNHVPNRFYCFSTSTAFQAQKIYKPYAVFGILNHGSSPDWLTVAKDLEGKYNRPSKTPTKPKETKEAETEETDPLKERVDYLRMSEQAREILQLEKEALPEEFKNAPTIPIDVYNNLPPFFEFLEGLDERRRDMAFIFSLGMLSGFFPDLQLDYDSIEMPVLYSYIVAPAGSGKGICSKVLKIFLPFHIERKEEGQRLRDEYKERLQIAKKSKELFTEKEPPNAKLIITGDTSSSALSLDLIHQNIIVADSEGDTIHNALKQDWGGFSDILRKCYHQEFISRSRTTAESGENFNPKMSLAITSTPSQIQGIIGNEKDGLVSRFMFYRFSKEFVFKAPGLNRVIESNEWVERIETATNYLKICQDLGPCVVTFSPSQWAAIQHKGEELTNYVKLFSNDNVPQMITRGITQWARIAAIITQLNRKIPNYTPDPVNIVCSDTDFFTAKMIFEVVFWSNIRIFFEIADATSAKEPQKARKMGAEFQLWDILPEEFETSKEGVFNAKCEELQINSSTARKWLKRWKKRGLLDSEKRGTYKKKTNEPSKIIFEKAVEDLPF